MCPRCKNEEISDDAKFCKICGLEIVERKVLVYGDGTNVIEVGRIVDGKQIYIYLPQIQVNKKMCTIHDNNNKTISGSIECADKVTAIIIAKRVLGELKDKQGRGIKK